MKKLFVVTLIGLMLMAVSSFAQESIPEFNAANVNIAKTKVADKVKLSKDADDMLTLMVKFTPGNTFKKTPDLLGNKKTGWKSGKFKFPQIVIENGKISNINLQLTGQRIEEEIMPVLANMYGEPQISNHDGVYALINMLFKVPGKEAECQGNDHKYVKYKWKNKYVDIQLSANDDAIFNCTDGRRMKKIDKNTLIIFSAR